MQEKITEFPQFFTATILNWQKLLQPEKYKKVVIDSLDFLVASKRIFLNAFVIMDNHIHLIWQMRASTNPSALQRDFLKFTAQQIKTDLQKNHNTVLACFRVNASDRQYQFWERNSLSVELRTHKVALQKLNYIHWNPVRAGICGAQEEYKYSSALFYQTGIDNWGFLTHYLY